MPAARDTVTGYVYRRPGNRPPEFVATSSFRVGRRSRFLVGGRSARRGFFIATDRNTENQITEFDLYADVNNNRRYDRRDIQIGEGRILPRFVGGYESAPIGAVGDFTASLLNGTFSVASDGQVSATGILFV